MVGKGKEVQHIERLKQHKRTLTTPLIFAGLFFFNCLLTKNFAGWYTVRSILTQSTSLVLIAIGTTFVIAAGGIDISLGSGFAWNAILFALVLQQTGSLAAALLAVLVSAVAIGLINGINVARFRVQPMIATMAMMYILRAFSKVLTNGANVRIRSPLLKEFCYMKFFGGVIPIQLFIVLIPLAAALILVKKTFFGIYIEACGDNLEAARISGIRVVLCTVSAYIICNVLTALAGVFDAGSVSSADPMAMGILMEMDAIAATVIGGTSITGGRPNFIGTIFGVFILRMITIMINMNNIPEQWSYIVTAATIIAAVVFQNIKKLKEA